MKDMTLLKRALEDLLDNFEEEVVANKPRKAILPPIKGKAYDDGRVGTFELKKLIDTLSTDDKNLLLVAGIVVGCLNLGRDAGEYITRTKANKILSPFISQKLKQEEISKRREYFFKGECLKIAELTWAKYPKATTASLGGKLCDYFCNVKNYQVSQMTIEKKWLSRAPFRPEFRGDRNLNYELVFE